MKAEQKDRRVRRTRQLLHEALIALILEQPYQTISVQDILDRADIGRSTFYAHFRDKDDLFEYGIERMLDALGHDLGEPEHSDAAGPLIPSLELFRHVQKNHPLYKALLRGQGLELLLKRGQATLVERIAQHLERQAPAAGQAQISVQVQAVYLAGSLITLLQWWLDNHMPYSPERMDEIYRRLTFSGILGLYE